MNMLTAHLGRGEHDQIATLAERSLRDRPTDTGAEAQRSEGLQGLLSDGLRIAKALACGLGTRLKPATEPRRIGMKTRVVITDLEAAGAKDFAFRHSLGEFESLVASAPIPAVLHLE